MKRILLTLALFVAFGSMAFATTGTNTASGTGNFTIYEAHGLTMRQVNNVDLGWVLPGQVKTFNSIAPMAFLVDGAGSSLDPSAPSQINAQIYWNLASGENWFYGDGGNLALKTNVTFGADNNPPGTDDQTHLGYDGIAALYINPVQLNANSTLNSVGTTVSIPVTVTCTYVTNQ
ncbi:MAG: hypothetical protein ACM3U1_00760 [Chloroflexota bacterium]